MAIVGSEGDGKFLIQMVPGCGAGLTAEMDEPPCPEMGCSGGGCANPRLDCCTSACGRPAWARFALSILIKGGIADGGADPLCSPDAAVDGSAPPPLTAPPPLDGVDFFFPFFGICPLLLACLINEQSIGYRENDFLFYFFKAATRTNCAPLCFIALMACSVRLGTKPRSASSMM